MSDLKPCPFCGVRLFAKDGCWIHPRDETCLADGTILETRQQIRVWNRRVSVKERGQMSDLKPGYVRVFQCEKCGAVFDTKLTACNHFKVEGGRLTACGGPITERILADPDVVREECAKVAEEHFSETTWHLGETEPMTITREIANEIRALSGREGGEDEC